MYVSLFFSLSVCLSLCLSVSLPHCLSVSLSRRVATFRPMKTCILRDDIVFRAYNIIHFQTRGLQLTHPFSSMTCIQFHMHTCLRERCIGTTACIHTRTLSPKVYIHRPTHSTRLSSTP